MAEFFKVYDFDPRKLPAELRAAIGLVSACNTQTETIIQDAIAGVAGLTVEDGLAITTHMNLPARMHTLKSLARLKLSNDLSTELDGLLEEIEMVTRNRNAYIHGTWAIDPETGETFLQTIRSRGKLKLTFAPANTEDVLNAAEEIYRAGEQLHLFLSLRKLMPRFADET